MTYNPSKICWDLPYDFHLRQEGTNYIIYKTFYHTGRFNRVYKETKDVLTLPFFHFSREDAEAVLKIHKRHGRLVVEECDDEDPQC